MHEAVQGECPADWVVNLDKVVIPDQEERKPKKAVAAITITSHRFHHRMSRELKRIHRARFAFNRTEPEETQAITSPPIIDSFDL
jgi:hypothetical protein